MSDLSTLIETLEHKLMRSWMRRDSSELKSLVDRSCIVQFAGPKRVILDRLSWVEAVKDDFRCHGYQMGDVYVRKHGPVAILTARFELDMEVRGEVWKGQFWVNDVWKKSRIRRSYRLVERSLSRAESEPEVAAKIRSLQLWR